MKKCNNRKSAKFVQFLIFGLIIPISFAENTKNDKLSNLHQSITKYAHSSQYTDVEELSEPSSIKRYLAIDNVCAWPKLVLLPDNTIAAFIHNRPSHGGMEGGIDCWVSKDGEFWEKRGIAVQNDPNTVRMNVASGLTKNGELIILCSGWTNEQQPGLPKRAKLRDAILPLVISRSDDGGKTWTQHNGFPSAEKGWSEFIPFGPIVKGENNILYASCFDRKLSTDINSSRAVGPDGARSWFFSSHDDGKTWQKISMIGSFHGETSLMHLDGQNWLAAARRRKPAIVELFSSNDNGTTWHSAQKLSNEGQVNGHLLHLNDGRILFTYGNRSATEGGRGVLAKISGDEGNTWSYPIRIAYLGGDLGYPSSVQRADGKIVTAYYSKEIENHMRYHMGVAIWDAP